MRSSPFQAALRALRRTLSTRDRSGSRLQRWGLAGRGARRCGPELPRLPGTSSGLLGEVLGRLAEPVSDEAPADPARRRGVGSSGAVPWTARAAAAGSGPGGRSRRAGRDPWRPGAPSRAALARGPFAPDSVAVGREGLIGSGTAAAGAGGLLPGGRERGMGRPPVAVDPAAARALLQALWERQVGRASDEDAASTADERTARRHGVRGHDTRPTDVDRARPAGTSPTRRAVRRLERLLTPTDPARTRTADPPQSPRTSGPSQGPAEGLPPAASRVPGGRRAGLLLARRAPVAGGARRPWPGTVSISWATALAGGVPTTAGSLPSASPAERSRVAPGPGMQAPGGRGAPSAADASRASRTGAEPDAGRTSRSGPAPRAAAASGTTQATSADPRPAGSAPRPGAPAVTADAHSTTHDGRPAPHPADPLAGLWARARSRRLAPLPDADQGLPVQGAHTPSGTGSTGQRGTGDGGAAPTTAAARDALTRGPLGDGAAPAVRPAARTAARTRSWPARRARSAAATDGGPPTTAARTPAPRVPVPRVPVPADAAPGATGEGTTPAPPGAASHDGVLGAQALADLAAELRGVLSARERRGDGVVERGSPPTDPRGGDLEEALTDLLARQARRRGIDV